MFSIEKNEILKSSWIGKALNKNVHYLMYYPSKWKHFTLHVARLQCTFTLHSKQWFHEEQEAEFSMVRNDFGRAFICWWVIFFEKVRLLSRLSCKKGF